MSIPEFIERMPILNQPTKVLLADTYSRISLLPDSEKLVVLEQVKQRAVDARAKDLKRLADGLEAVISELENNWVRTARVLSSEVRALPARVIKPVIKEESPMKALFREAYQRAPNAAKKLF
ncbi:MAG TPA: hypothetical protein VLF94_05415 [Chlamydiales bacterium]|nr:hypothetical protein [Chlamydiales bacterium]